MVELKSKSGERILPEKYESVEDYLIYLHHIFTYEFAENKIPKKSFVLEVGCGEGYGTSMLSKKAKKIIGIDVDKKIIEHASKKYGTEKCRFEVYDGKKIPYKNNVFDAVVSFQVIEHVKDDKNYVSEIWRVLRKNGIFLITTPNRTHRLKPGQKPWNRFHIREYYPEELENLLKNKFSGVKIRGISGNEEMQRIEIERAKVNMRIASLDPFNLRSIMPEWLKIGIVKILKIVLGKKKRERKSDFIGRFSFHDYRIKTNARESLDLLGICRK